MNNKTPDNYRLEDFITDESFRNYCLKLNREDLLFWEKWIAENPDKAWMTDQAAKMIEILSGSVSEEAIDRELIKLEGKIAMQPIRGTNDATRENIQSPMKKFRLRKIVYWTSVAAVVLLGFYLLFSHTDRATDVMNNEKVIVAQSDSLYIGLPDNTSVILFPRSSLEFDSVVFSNQRTIKLSGGARFMVRKDARHPFKVYSGGLISTVLGTVFDINRFEDSSVKINLFEGRLKVEIEDGEKNDSDMQYLNPNESVSYFIAQRQLVKSYPPVKDDIEFKGSNYQEIADKIKSVYGVILRNESNKSDWRFTGSFKQRTAEEVVKNICLIKDLKYTVSGNTITITD